MKGWKNESYRHYLAAKGIKTSRYEAKKPMYFASIMKHIPSMAKRDAWFVDAFGKDQSRQDYYYQEVLDRFDTPRHVWQKSDGTRRAALKKHFPEKFGKLDINANVNPSKPGEYAEFARW